MKNWYIKVKLLGNLPDCVLLPSPETFIYFYFYEYLARQLHPVLLVAQLMAEYLFYQKY